MRFDRLAIAEGLYWYYTYHHAGQNSDSYKKLCQASRLYKPGMYERGPTTEEAREVYSRKFEQDNGYQGYNDCSCRDCFETAIGVPDIALCHECDDAGCEPWYINADCEVERFDEEDGEEE